MKAIDRFHILRFDGAGYRPIGTLSKNGDGRFHSEPLIGRDGKDLRDDLAPGETLYLQPDDGRSSMPGLVGDELNNILYGHFGLYGRSLGDIWRWLGFFKSFFYAATMYNAKAVAAVPFRLKMRVPRKQRPGNVKFRELTPFEQRLHRMQRRDIDHTRGGREEVIEILDHPAINFYRNPNQWQDAYELAIKEVLYLQYTGNAYTQIIRDGFGDPAGLFLLPSQFVWVDVQGQKGIDGYRVGFAGENFLPEEDVIHAKLPSLGGRNRDWSGLVYGRGFAEAAVDSLVKLDKLHEFDHRYLDNFGQPPFFIVLDGAVSDDQREMIKAEMRIFLRDPENAGVGMVLHKADVKTLGAQGGSNHGMVSADSSTGRDMIVQEICAITGAPYAVFSHNQSTAGGVADQADPWHLKNVVVPFCTMLAQRRNAMLLREWGDDRLFYEFDDPISLLGQAEETREDFQSNIIKLNEARAARGFDPVEGPKGEMLWSELQSAGQGGAMGMPGSGELPGAGFGTDEEADKPSLPYRIDPDAEIPDGITPQEPGSKPRPQDEPEEVDIVEGRNGTLLVRQRGAKRTHMLVPPIHITLGEVNVEPPLVILEAPPPAKVDVHADNHVYVAPADVQVRNEFNPEFKPNFAPTMRAVMPSQPAPVVNVIPPMPEPPVVNLLPPEVPKVRSVAKRVIRDETGRAQGTVERNLYTEEEEQAAETEMRQQTMFPEMNDD